MRFSFYGKHLVVFTILITGVLTGQSPLRVMRSDAGGCVLEYRGQELKLTETYQSGRLYYRWETDNGFQTRSLPGEPDMPVASGQIALPYGAGVTASVQVLESEELSGYRLLPAPSFEYDNEGMVIATAYTESATYSENRWFPENVTDVSPPSLLRDINTAGITFTPVQYHPLMNKIRIIRRAIITLSFSNALRTARYQTETSVSDEFPSGLFLNESSARQWRVRSAMEKTFLSVGNRLSAGKWYKIRITEDGLYKLDKKFFEDLGEKVSSIDPMTIKIYNNGGGNLPLLPDSLNLSDPNNLRGIRPLDLRENAIWVQGESDRKFDGGDYVLFYGRGTKSWQYDSSSNKYQFRTNYYTEENIYWLTFNDGVTGKRMVSQPSAGSAYVRQNTFLHRYHYEKDEENFYQSGLVWVMKSMGAGQTFTYPASSEIPDGGLLNDRDAASEVTYTIKFKGSSVEGTGNYFRVTVDNSSTYTTSVFSGMRSQLLSFSLPPSVLSGGRINVSYYNNKAGSTAALDWFEIQYNRKLNLYKDKLTVFSPAQAGVYAYPVALKGISGDGTRVFDITRHDEVREILPLSVAGDTLWFADEVAAKQPKRYWIAHSRSYRTVNKSQVTLDVNSDLANTSNRADYLIITHPNFRQQALRLASHRQSKNGFRTMVVDVQDIFDEFGAGLPDPVAIRDFLRYAYYRWQTPDKHDHLFYVLLMGDGDYDYRNVLIQSDHNWIPTYQIQSDVPGSGFAIETRESDDMYTYINDVNIYNDNSDGNFTYPQLYLPAADLSIGRIPCNTDNEAKAAVDKILYHENMSGIEAWRHKITLVADDECAPGSGSELDLHIGPTEQMANDTSMIGPSWLQEKIYLTEYPCEMLGSTCFKRQARDRFLEAINEGSMIVNFVGHGNPKQLSHERLYMDETDFPLIQNQGKYFYFTNFSCSFAKFDQTDRQGGGEKLVVTPGRGAFALFAATRAVYAGVNTDLMKQIFISLKQKGTLGKSVFYGKRAMPISRFHQVNNEKYVLLGDPALTINYPTPELTIASVQPVTIKALAQTAIHGRINLPGGSINSGFNGEAEITLLDRVINKTYTSKPGCGTGSTAYNLWGSTLFRGKTQVQNGEFIINFIPPKDLSYSYLKGKILAVATDGSSWVGGAYNDIIIDSLSADRLDTVGPAVTIGFEGQPFYNGDPVRQNPVLNIFFRDSSGINVTASAGHGIQLVIDHATVINLSSQYTTATGDFTQGTVSRTLSGLETGKHTASLTVFDNLNNVTRTDFSFTVVPTVTASGKLEPVKLRDVMNYPNPFRRYTNFTFICNHSAGDVEIRIYTISGKQINKIDASASFGYNSIFWDGRDADGNRLANGLYLYKITLRSSENNTRSEYIGKLIISK